MPKNGLRVLNNVVAGATCYATHEKYGVNCLRRRCRNWVSMKEHHNCTLIAASEGRLTLDEIGKIYSVSRMQICKVQSQLLSRISQKLNVSDD